MLVKNKMAEKNTTKNKKISSYTYQVFQGYNFLYLYRPVIGAIDFKELACLDWSPEGISAGNVSGSLV